MLKMMLKRQEKRLKMMPEEMAEEITIELAEIVPTPENTEIPAGHSNYITL